MKGRLVNRSSDSTERSDEATGATVVRPSTMGELRAELERRGWSVEKDRMRNDPPGWYAWISQRWTGMPICHCNDKPPSLHLRPWQVEMHGDVWRSVEFEMCGETAEGLWVKIHAYSVQMDEAFERLPIITATLRRAWIAAATTTAPGASPQRSAQIEKPPEGGPQDDS
jgi:hypothetical protein